MSRERCVFCMEEIEEGAVCPACRKGIWEYDWKEEWLEPYTILKEKYLVGAVSMAGTDFVRYIGYDLILEQKVWLRVYSKDSWKKTGEKEARLLFGKYDFPGIPGVRDYFESEESGYMVTEYLAGQTLRNYCKKNVRMTQTKVESLWLSLLEGLEQIHALGMIAGNLSPDTLVVTEEGNLAAPGAPAPKGERSRYLAPEQREKEGVTGPWSDVYAVCAMWYEMLTGRPVPETEEREKTGRLKKPSRYIKISANVEEALLQGLAMEPQRRFFSIQNMKESMGLSETSEDEWMGVTRHIWGTAWLETARSSGVSGKKRRRRYLLKRLVAAVVILAVVCGITVGGFWIYRETHREEMILWQVKRDRNEYEDRTKEAVLARESSEYDKVLTFLETYGELDDVSSGDSQNYYELKEEDMEHCPEFYGTEKGFYLDIHTAMEALQYYMDLEEKLDLSAEYWRGAGSVNKNDEKEITTYLSKTEEYYTRKTGEEVSVRYDPSDDQLQSISFQGSRERCVKFLEKMIPVLLSESYLTKEEAEGMVNLDFQKDETDLFGKMYSLTLPGGYEILISVPSEAMSSGQGENTRQNNPDLLEVEISGRSRDMRVLEEGVVYAGNYPRDSKRYQEFLTFVKEHASSVEEIRDEETTLLGSRQETVYKLEKEDVEEWGEPCNFVRFLTDKDTFVSWMRNRGYEMKLLKEGDNNQVEVNGYGGILTSFIHKERYQVSEGVFLTVNSDTVNHQILGVVIYREKGSNVSLKELAVCVTAFIQGKEEKEFSDTMEMLDEVEADIEHAKSNTFIISGEATLMFSDSEDSDYEITIVSQNVYESNPYWP
ncbi:serine/threonine protein kinase [Mordavella massiliensis]|nr:hypothetical protein [Mordavella massiliensis]